jgi:hypothetical protein
MSHIYMHNVLAAYRSIRSYCYLLLLLHVYTPHPSSPSRISPPSHAMKVRHFRRPIPSHLNSHHVALPLSSLSRHHVHSCLEQVIHASRRTDAWIPGVPNASLPTPSTRPTVIPGLQDFPMRHPRGSTALAPKLDGHDCLPWTLTGFVGYIDYPGGGGEEPTHSRPHSSTLNSKQTERAITHSARATKCGELTNTSPSSSS